MTSSGLPERGDTGVITGPGPALLSPASDVATCPSAHLEEEAARRSEQLRTAGQDEKLFKVHQSFSTVKFLAQSQSLMGTCQ